MGTQGKEKNREDISFCALNDELSKKVFRLFSFLETSLEVITQQQQSEDQDNDMYVHNRNDISPPLSLRFELLRFQNDDF